MLMIYDNAKIESLLGYLRQIFQNVTWKSDFEKQIQQI